MVKYDVIASTGTYMKDGQEKKRWQKCGVVMETKNGGLAMKLDVVPVVGEGWFMLSEPKDNAPKPQSNQSDDVPW